MSDFIIDEFYEEMKTVKFEPYGILDSQNKIHTLGTDSKIIGRIFEMYAQPILEKIAAKHGMILTTPESQTVYPDFIMMSSKDSKEKIAIDIKTTYIDSDQSTIKFTLGSYGSYMRNNTKNIESMLAQNELDIALVEGNIVRQEILKTPIFEDDLCLICSSKHPFARKKNITLEDLKEEELNNLIEQKLNETLSHTLEGQYSIKAQKTLKKQINNSKIELEIFIVAEEQISSISK